MADQVYPRYLPSETDVDLTFQVNIINDNIPEDQEYFEINLTLNPTGNGNGFFYPTAVGRVTIIDDDTCKLVLV